MTEQQHIDPILHVEPDLSEHAPDSARYPLLSRIESPADLRGLSAEQ